MNQASTRSHCIFTIHLCSKELGSAMVRCSKLHLVDLAGSERVGKTGVGGQILTEAKYINLSLHYLEQVSGLSLLQRFLLYYFFLKLHYGILPSLTMWLKHGIPSYFQKCFMLCFQLFYTDKFDGFRFTHSCFHYHISTDQHIYEK